MGCKIDNLALKIKTDTDSNQARFGSEEEEESHTSLLELPGSLHKDVKTK